MTAGAPVPRATYRLQLHKNFRFADAASLAGYLGQLGISHVYLSPILKARAGSTHGYDTVDHGEINPELGTADEFRAMARALRRHGLGIILDVVPNHMGVGGADNPYWLDVLRHGEKSRYAGWFDIGWHSPTPGLDGKLLVPFLGKPAAEALADGDIEVRYDEATGGFAAWAYRHHKLPLAPETEAGLSAAGLARLNADKAALAALLARQHWQLAQASRGDDEINYRRFFIVSDLAAIRIEQPEVFAHVHRIAFELIGEGLVDGLRVDHVDGLFDPKAYCQKLCETSPRPIYIIVEKVLGADETLPETWGVEGTTGYEFGALVTPLLVDAGAEEALTAFHRDFTGVEGTPPELEWAAKCEMMDHELAAELDALSWQFARLALGAGLDVSRLALRRALRSFIAATPIYRTYVDAAAASATDRAVIDATLADATRREPELDGWALTFIGRVMRREVPGEAAAITAMRLQQVTGPVMAKGLEDTALYRYNRLIALNDVGERPGRFSLPIADFHAANLERLTHFPHCMLGTSSHDSKRGEDARCRIAALSGYAAAWIAAVPQWLAVLEQAGAPGIARDDAYYFFQLLLGAWPGEASAAFIERMLGAMRKSLREARLRTSWRRPDEAYEGDVEAFIRLAFDPARCGFLVAFEAFEAKIGRAGADNGLIETALKLTVPGVPDIYQGAELWKQSMVDPDNRRPVDFSLRQQLLDNNEDRPVAELARHWRDGAVKQAMIARLLAVRRSHPELFAVGTYLPIAASERVCAFARQQDDAAVIVAVRLYPSRNGETGQLALPETLAGFAWTDPLSGAAIDPAAWLDFSGLPVAIGVGRRT